MNKKRSMQYILVFSLAAGMTLSFPVTNAKAYTCDGTADAVTICSPEESPFVNGEPFPDCDTDLDGFTDVQECAGIVLPYNPDTTEPSDTSVTYRYTSNCSGNTCLDPARPDLFLIIVPADDNPDPVDACIKDDNTYMNSLLPADFDFLYPSTDPQDSKGLGLVVHRIDASLAPSHQLITGAQRAIKMIESCSTADPDVAGAATRGVLPQELFGKIYTYVIQNKIYTVCPPDGSVVCYDGSGNQVDANTLVTSHIVNTFNHEVGHMLGLSVNYDRKIDYHWPAGTGVELDQFVDCSARKGTATCYTYDIHADPDIGGMRLR